MADDKTPATPDADLPAPDDSPFFSDEPSPEPIAEGSDEAPEPAAEPEPELEPEPATEPETSDEPEPEQEPATEPAAELQGASDDLGSTHPYTPVFDELHDPALAQPTQLLSPVTPEPIPPFDPAAAEMTQLVPVVPGPEGEQPPQGEQPAAPAVEATVPTVIAGSRVVIVISRGAPEMPPIALVGVPHVIGMSQGDALSQLQQAGLSAQVFNEYSGLSRGEVIGQLPAYGQTAPSGSEAVLLVSAGPAPAATLSVPLPDVVGLTEADALAKLQQAGLSPQIVRDFSANVPLGVVVEQLPNGHGVAEAPRKGGGSLWWLWLLLIVAAAFAASGGAYYWLNRTAAVPNVVGLTQAQAEQAIQAAGFKLGSLGTTQTVAASDVGKVTTQTPAPNTQTRLINQVDIVVSGGQLLFAVPDVTSKPQAEASSTIIAQGLQVAKTEAYSPTVPKDAVISQSPAAGQKVPAGTTVGLTISLGVQSVTVPGVLNQTRTQAADSLKSASLKSQSVVDYWIGGINDSVVAQYPTAGMVVTPGTIVGLIVSKGDPTSTLGTATVSVPTLVGKKQKAAQSSLSNVGLSNTIINWSGTGQAAGNVVGQVPEAGTQIPKKSTVIIIISNGK